MNRSALRLVIKMPKFHSRPQRRTTPPNRSWDGFFTPAIVTVAAATKVLLGTFTLNNPGIDETFLRAVGRYFINTDTGANEQQIGAIGMIVVSETAVAAGVASIPGPTSDIGNDGWFFHSTFCQDWQFSDATGQRIGGLSYEFDSRGKRVIHDQSAVAIVVENTHATHGFQIQVAMRVLSQVRGT